MYKTKIEQGIVRPSRIKLLTDKGCIVECVIEFTDLDLLIGNVNVG